MNIKEKLMMS